MTLLLACLVIYGLGLPPFLYGAAFIVWVVSVIVRFWVLSQVGHR